MSLRLPAVALGVALSMAAPSGLDAARVGAESQDPGIADRDTVRIPSSLREEHEEIRRDLDRAMLEPGRTGEAARALAALMEPHFVKEEELALPPLGILPDLAADRITPEMAPIADLASRLEAELPTMIEEHVDIAAAASALADAARTEGRPEIEAFAERILHHARTEEEVTYPAAVVAGRYARSRLAP